MSEPDGPAEFTFGTRRTAELVLRSLRTGKDARLPSLANLPLPPEQRLGLADDANALEQCAKLILEDLL
jgi:hypothetical protein